MSNEQMEKMEEIVEKIPNIESPNVIKPVAVMGNLPQNPSAGNNNPEPKVPEVKKPDSNVAQLKSAKKASEAKMTLKDIMAIDVSSPLGQQKQRRLLTELKARNEKKS